MEFHPWDRHDGRKETTPTDFVFCLTHESKCTQQYKNKKPSNRTGTTATSFKAESSHSCRNQLDSPHAASGCGAREEGAVSQDASINLSEEWCGASLFLVLDSVSWLRNPASKTQG